MFLYRLIPTYGNWGGPGWSGGRYPCSPQETDWSVSAVDSMDEYFKEHDRRYQRSIIEYSHKKYLQREIWKDADRELIEGLISLSEDFTLWDKPTQNTKYTKWYKYFATIIFSYRCGDSN